MVFGFFKALEKIKIYSEIRLSRENKKSFKRRINNYFFIAKNN
jgi:hypothetical protein